MMGGTFSHIGTSGQKISFQYTLEPDTFVMKKVNNAKTKVMAELPVTVTPKGKERYQAHKIAQQDIEKCREQIG